MKDYKDGELNKLRRRIKRLEEENHRLKSELKTFNKAFAKTSKYLKDNTDGFSVEKVIEASKKEKTLQETREEDKCPECGEELSYSSLPFGRLILCKACNYRKTENSSNCKENDET